MQLALTVFGVVSLITVLLGAVGYLIDKSARVHEREEH
jgi:hypothetical protein